MSDKKMVYVAGDTLMGMSLYAVTKTIIEENPDDDYYAINDKVHDKLKETFQYTHDLRKEYQNQIRYILKKNGRE